MKELSEILFGTTSMETIRDNFYVYREVLDKLTDQYLSWEREHDGIERMIYWMLDRGVASTVEIEEMRQKAKLFVREAKNRDEFLTKIYEATGIFVEAIEGIKEAELIYLGVLKALKVKKKRVLCIDIGGGSTEFLLGDKGRPIFTESIKVGAVRLSKMFFPDYYITQRSIDECEKYIASKILAKSNLHSHHQFDCVVGTSGTINAAGSILYFRRHNEFAKSLNGFTFKAKEFFEMTEDVLRCESPVDRLSIKGMEIKRADIIPAGLLILKKVFDIFDIEKMIVSENALREGIIIETIKQEDEHMVISV